MEKKSTVVLDKKEHHLRREKRQTKQGMIISWDVEIYANTYAQKIRNNDKMCISLCQIGKPIVIWN